MLVFTNILNYYYDFLIGILMDPKIICKLYIFKHFLFKPYSSLLCRGIDYMKCPGFSVDAGSVSVRGALFFLLSDQCSSW